jgi:predicted dehydrogenase
VAEPRPVRWAVLGAANIFRANFLPSLRAAGGGEVVAVGSRDRGRAAQLLAREEVECRILDYPGAVAADDVDAVYVALPNTLHVEWAGAALRAGKAVLCEKPLGVDLSEVEELVNLARGARTPLWEAFAFPFHRQYLRAEELISAGEIGELREVVSHFHFPVRRPDNIRWSPELAGGALNDVGCYPVHLAALLFRQVPGRALVSTTPAASGVDLESCGLLEYGGGLRLLFSSGLSRARDTTTRLVGSEGSLELTDPFHPGAHDTFELRTAGRPGKRERLMTDEPTFAPLLRHIHGVLAEEVAPRHLAIQDSVPTAQALEWVRAAASREPGR